jgi:regulatory protein
MESKKDRKGRKAGRREGGKEGRREGGKEGRREGGKEGGNEGRDEAGMTPPKHPSKHIHRACLIVIGQRYTTTALRGGVH